MVKAAARRNIDLIVAFIADTVPGTRGKGKVSNLL